MGLIENCLMIYKLVERVKEGGGVTMIVITGAAGFIGSVLVGYLNRKNINDILCVDRMRSQGKYKNLIGKDFIDIVSPEKMFDYIQEKHLQVDVIVHLGACSSTTEENMDYLLDNNYRFSQQIYEWCGLHNVRMIYASSASTYGIGEKGYSDSTTDLRPLNKYGYSKQLFDLWQLKQKKIKQCVGFKFFNVYGPNEYHKITMSSLILKFYNEIQEYGYVNMYGEDGKQARDFVHVFDVVKVIDHFIQNSEISGIFNVGTGEASVFNDIAKVIFDALDLPVDIHYVSMPDYLVNIYQWYTKADLTKLRSVGYTDSFYSMESGVTDYIKNYASHKKYY